MPGPSTLPEPIWRARGRKAPLLALSLCLLLVAFWPTLRSFPDVWSRYTYSHGYLIPPVVLWLAWRRRRALMEGKGGRADAALLAALLSLVWLVALVTHVQVVHQGLFPLILLAWVVAAAGWHAGRRLLPAAVVFLFAVPFWEVLTPILQGLTIFVTGTVLRAAGIQAQITGEYVTIPSGTFQIAHSCSGLNFFIVGLLLGVLYAHLFVPRWRERIQVMALAVGLAVVANWIRVASLVVIGHVTEMQWPYLENHGFYGWVVFVVMFAGFFPLAGRVARRSEARTADPAEPSPSEKAPAGGGSGPGLAAATLLAILGPLLLAGVGILPAATLEQPPEPPAVLGPWTRLSDGADPPLGWRPRYPEPDARYEYAWSDGSTVAYELELVYRAQDQGRELVGGDSRIAPPAYPVVEGLRRLDGGTLAREAFVRTPEGLVALVYWYEVGGIRTVSASRAKLLELWGFLRRRPSAALVTFSAACVSEECATERQALADLVSRRMP